MRPGFLRRWIVVVTVGEAAGFAVPAVVGALLFDEPAQLLVPALLVAGAVEGALLGGAQWWVLGAELTALTARTWIGLTSAGAVVAYAIGLLPSTFWETWSSWPSAVVVPLFILLGLALLTSIGTAQWLELRHHVAHAGRWIVGTTAAWLVALGVFVAISTPLWQEGQSLGLRIAIGLLAGLVMAVTMAAVTGRVMRSLLHA
ncbi:MAG TPA: hypothetical protein VFN43_04690 [Humibacillus sp.]|nr:hypothetical protein [Humibacillus sp.]